MLGQKCSQSDEGRGKNNSLFWLGLKGEVSEGGVSGRREGMEAGKQAAKGVDSVAQWWAGAEVYGGWATWR